MRSVGAGFGLWLALSALLHGLGLGAVALTLREGPPAALAPASIVDVDEIVVSSSRRGSGLQRVKPESAPALAPVPVAPVSVPPAAAGVSTTVTINADTGPRTLTLAEVERWVRAHNAPPAYPRASNEAREQGRALVRVLVRRDGSVESLELETGSGHERLDHAALETVRGWTFPSFSGEQDKLVLRFPFRFELYD